MAANYEYLFETNLHARLKEKIIGKIFVKVTRDDALLVKIESFGGLNFSTTIDGFSDRILNGYSTEYAAYEIVSQYRKFVIHKFIK